ncbi:MAG: hypothetical protein ACETVN_02295, partial [Asgard group archaeon]
TDEEGNKDWDQTYEKGDFDVGECVLQTTDGNYIIVGSTISYEEGYSDIWFLKVSEEEGFLEKLGGTGTVLLVLAVIGIAVVLVALFMKRKQES